MCMCTQVNEDLWELRRTVLLARVRVCLKHTCLYSKHTYVTYYVQGEWEGDIDSEVPTPGVLSPFTLSQESSLSLGTTTVYTEDNDNQFTVTLMCLLIWPSLMSLIVIYSPSLHRRNCLSQWQV